MAKVVIKEYDYSYKDLQGNVQTTTIEYSYFEAYYCQRVLPDLKNESKQSGVAVPTGTTKVWETKLNVTTTKILDIDLRLSFELVAVKDGGFFSGSAEYGRETVTVKIPAGFGTVQPTIRCKTETVGLGFSTNLRYEVRPIEDAGLVVPDIEILPEYDIVPTYSAELRKGIDHAKNFQGERTVDCRIDLFLRNNLQAPIRIKYRQYPPITITRDFDLSNPLKPVLGVSATLGLRAEESQQYKSLYSQRDGILKMQYFEGNEMIYEGYSINQLYQETYYNPPYDTKLDFTCGIALMKNLPFSMPGDARHTVRNIIEHILLQINSDLPIFVKSWLQTGGNIRLFEQHEIDIRSFAEDNCYEVLQKICLGHGWVFYKSWGKYDGEKQCFWLLRDAVMKREPGHTFLKYEREKDSVSVNNFNSIYELDRLRKPVEAYRINLQESVLSVSPAINRIKLTKSLTNVPDLFEYPSFEEGAWKYQEDRQKLPDPRKVYGDWLLSDWAVKVIRPDDPVNGQNPNTINYTKLNVDGLPSLAIVKQLRPPRFPDQTQEDYDAELENSRAYFHPANTPDYTVCLEHRGVDVVSGPNNFLQFFMSYGLITYTTDFDAVQKERQAALPIELVLVYDDESGARRAKYYNYDTDSWSEISTELSITNLRLPTSYKPGGAFNFEINRFSVPHDGELKIRIYNPLDVVYAGDVPLNPFLASGIFGAHIFKVDLAYYTESGFSTYKEEYEALVGNEKVFSTYELETHLTDGENIQNLSAITIGGEVVTAGYKNVFVGIDDEAPLHEHLAKNAFMLLYDTSRMEKVNITMKDYKDEMNPELILLFWDDDEVGEPEAGYLVGPYTYTPIGRSIDNTWTFDAYQIKHSKVQPSFLQVEKKASSQRSGGVSGGLAQYNDQKNVNVVGAVGDLQAVTNIGNQTTNPLIVGGTTYGDGGFISDAQQFNLDGQGFITGQGVTITGILALPNVPLSNGFGSVLGLIASGEARLLKPKDFMRLGANLSFAADGTTLNVSIPSQGTVDYNSLINKPITNQTGGIKRVDGQLQLTQYSTGAYFRLAYVTSSGVMGQISLSQLDIATRAYVNQQIANIPQGVEDGVINSLSFNSGSGVLTAGRTKGGSVTGGLDGRYLRDSNVRDFVQQVNARITTQQIFTVGSLPSAFHHFYVLVVLNSASNPSVNDLVLRGGVGIAGLGVWGNSSFYKEQASQSGNGYHTFSTMGTLSGNLRISLVGNGGNGFYCSTIYVRVSTQTK